MMAWKASKQLIINRKQLVAKFVEEASLVGYLVPRDNMNKPPTSLRRHY